MKQKGFTLIELLVVIVIIGILATISTATFDGHSKKARDAGKQATLSSSFIRAETESIFHSDGNYDGVCEDTEISTAVTGADADCFDSSGPMSFGWAIETEMESSAFSQGADQFYCLDVHGNAGRTFGSTVGSFDGRCDIPVNNSCIPGNGAIGSSCNFNSECENCYCSNLNRVCETPGGTCDVDGRCTGGLICAGGIACTDGSPGSYCESNSECNSGSCDFLSSNSCN